MSTRSFAWMLGSFLFPLATGAELSPALAVLEKRAGFVGFYAADGRRLAGARVGDFPHEAVLSPDRRTLYITDNGVLWLTDAGEGGNTVSIVDVRTMRRTGVIDLGRFRRPHGIAFGPEPGQLLVTTEKPPRLLLVDTHSRKVVRDFDVQGSNPHMVTLSRGTGYAFVSNTESGAVAAVRLSDGKLTLIPTAARPQGSVLSQDRSLLYVTNTGAARITVIDPLNLKVVKELPIGKGAGRIALAPDGNTLIYNLQEDQGVGFLDIATGRQTFFLPLHGRPLSLTLSRDGRRAFAGVQDQDKIFELSVPERKVLRVIAAPKDAGPDPAISLE